VRFLPKTWHRVTLALGLAGIALAWLAMQCRWNPNINFLPSDGRAKWILFPYAVEARTHAIVTLDATFRRQFTLDYLPQTSRLTLRAAKRVELKINRHLVELPGGGNWKKTKTVDALSFLQPGVNSIEARVFNDNAPPALWLTLTTDGSSLRTDATWEASFTGSSWRQVVLAEAVRFLGPGNSIAGGETLASSAGAWRIELIFCAVVLIGVLIFWVIGRQNTVVDLSGAQVALAIAVPAVAWLALFWNNACLMPFSAGFDQRAHINYIKFVLEHHTLPLPAQGFEMFQPPLYYVFSAMAVAACHLSLADNQAILLLRFLTVSFGILHFALVFLIARLLFPRQLVLQSVSFLLAAFLPMQLYLSHYITNETLAAVLVTASVYIALRLWHSNDRSLMKYGLLGLCLGAAMLAKPTAILVVPPLVIAMAAKFVMNPTARLVRNFSFVVVAALLVCGWHYLRMWRYAGTPFLGNWDPAAGFSWWQDPGFHVAVDYFRFGKALIAPFFSGFNGFADGMYSTLWGDGLCGGVPDLTYRPPWNYALMVPGYLLALVPTLLLFMGAATTAWRFVKNPSTDRFLLLGLSGTLIVGLILMTLKVASYAQVKAFYGLCALPAICFFVATGFDVITRRLKLLRFFIAGILVVWAINSFASFWIYNSIDRRVYAAHRLDLGDQSDAAIAEANKAAAADPSNAGAHQALAAIMSNLGRIDDAVVEARRAVQLDPLGSDGHAQLSLLLANKDDVDGAIEEARRAVALGPENLLARSVLVASLLYAHRIDEAVAAGHDGLSVSPFSADVHRNLGLALAQNGDLVTAANQFAYALLLRPGWNEANSDLHQALIFLTRAPNGLNDLQAAASSAPDLPEMLRELAWLLATNPDAALRDGSEAIHLAERGCSLTGSKNSALLVALAAAYAEVGRFPDAVRCAEQALSIARSSTDTDSANLSEKLLNCFKDNRPYRESPESS
jgi:tetratricopeptide (TPR) repeat protein